MKYLAIAGFAVVATAINARDVQWEPVVPAVKPTTWAPVPVKADPTWDAWKNQPMYTTTVVTAITTYCPEPTTIVHAGKTWTVKSATTLTITECPCTISVPVYVKTSTTCPVAADNTWVNAPIAATNTWVNTPVAATNTWVNTPVAATNTWVNTPVAATNTWSPVGVYKGAAVSNSINNALVLGAGAVAGAAALLL